MKTFATTLICLMMAATANAEFTVIARGFSSQFRQIEDGVETILLNPEDAGHAIMDVAIDPLHRYIYYSESDGVSERTRLRRIPFGGGVTPFEISNIPNTSWIGAISVDPINASLY